MYPEMDVDGREEAVDEADEPPCRVEGDGDREQDDTASDRVRSTGSGSGSGMTCKCDTRCAPYHPDINFFQAQLRITLEMPAP
jgi:hypothetical protein